MLDCNVGDSSSMRTRRGARMRSGIGGCGMIVVRGGRLVRGLEFVIGILLIGGAGRLGLLRFGFVVLFVFVFVERLFWT